MFIGVKRCFCIFVVDIQFCVYRGQRVFFRFRCWYSMKTRYVVLRTPKYFIVRCLFKFMRSCFVLLEIHSLFQIPLWKASFGGSCFFSIKNPNLRNIQIVFIAANVIFRVSSSKKTSWPLFMDRVQLPKVYRATTRRQFTFYHSVPKNSWYPLINLGRVKGWLDLVATRLLWTQDHWIGNPAS